MNCIKNSILRHLRLRAYVRATVLAGEVCGENFLIRPMCTAAATPGPEQILDRVVGLVKKFDRIDVSKVTETADFQKDLSLDSLDKVELVMALEQEFSLEIPEDVADKLTCCADVARYIASGTDAKTVER
ncbi:hypothetical protein MLD38_036725 [Melastoma candidum]|uniref:Uncharacterized protein n=1 Tax=Melastoma candidum TaxID=119954 RepID=A0ACB9LLT3_9MYRT|nr:hypothetical protein MLD38_036725 [Melastoma candidum]